MKGRLIPASGGLGRLPLSVEAVKLAAARMAERDAARAELEEVMSKMAESGLEKEAFIGPLLGLGRGLASRMARSGSRRISRIGQHLQRDVRSPIQITRSGRAGANVQARSPLSTAPPSLPHTRVGAPSAAPGGAPYRAAAPGAPVPPPRVDPMADTMPAMAMPSRGKSTDTARKGLFERLGGRVQESVAKRKASREAARATKKAPKPQSLLGSLVPGAILAGAGYGLYKGVPAAVDLATQASRYPMAPGLGFQQYQYGYTPEGQAQF